VLQASVRDLDPARRAVLLEDGGELDYDLLVLATGATHHYFGRDEWSALAPGLKTLEDATEIRGRVLSAFERAELERDANRRRALLTFVVVGGGPTGVELAGAIGELSRQTLRHDFRSIDPSSAHVVLLEGGPRILPTYDERLTRKAVRSLERLGVDVRVRSIVSEIHPGRVVVGADGKEETLAAETVLWAAGVRASGLGEVLAERAGVEPDPAGRIPVGEDCTVPGHPEIYVIGDLARFETPGGGTLPGVAPVAMSMGRFVAREIRRRVAGKPARRFRYLDKGALAVIGRAAAVAELGRLRFSGYFAWLLWLFVHIMYLVEFDNRLLVFLQWGWSYVTRNRSARLITAPPRR
jgi:NADH dehydrogenase